MEDLVNLDPDALEHIWAPPPVPEAWSGDGIIRTSEQCKEWADSLGCDVVVAQEDQLFIDIDSEERFQIFQIGIEVFKKHWFVKSVEIRPSKSGLPHRHIVVTTTNMKELTRIALQAALGSDPMRELLSIRRSLNSEENVVIFFEPKSNKERPEESRR